MPRQPIKPTPYFISLDLQPLMIVAVQQAADRVYVTSVSTAQPLAQVEIV